MLMKTTPPERDRQLRQIVRGTETNGATSARGGHWGVSFPWKLWLVWGLVSQLMCDVKRERKLTWRLNVLLNVPTVIYLGGINISALVSTCTSFCLMPRPVSVFISAHEYCYGNAKTVQLVGVNYRLKSRMLLLWFSVLNCCKILTTIRQKSVSTASASSCQIHGVHV